jgi:hypothetical protein
VTTQPIQPEQPADHDWLDVADAVGVTRAPKPLHPALRGVLSDANLAAVVSAWATAYAQPACGTCQETGLVEDRNWRTGETFHRTCTECQGDGGDVR